MNEPTDRLLELLAREGPSLHALLARVTLDRHTAEDLLQELSIKLAVSPGFKTAAHPAAYVRQSAIHLALDWRRSRRPIAAGNMPEAVDAAPPAAVALQQHEEWTRILDAATELTGQTREVFVLHYLEQQTFADIAIQLGKSAHQVRALAHKAIGQLRERLAPGRQTREGTHAA